MIESEGCGGNRSSAPGFFFESIPVAHFCVCCAVLLRAFFADENDMV